MNLVFIQPFWLWLLLLVPLLWFLPHRATNRIHAAIRSALFSLLIFALARPVLITNQDHPYQVIVWDRSESVGASMTAAVEGLVERLPDTSRTRVVTLNGTQKNVPKVGKLEPVNLSGSSVSQALAVGARLIPEGAVGALTLIGDGMATDRNWGDAVRQLVERKIPVNTVTVTVAENEVYPSAIRARTPLRVGQTTKLMVDVIGSAKQAVVTLWSEEKLLARSAPLVCGGHTTVELEFEPSRAGLLNVAASVQVLSGSDINPDNNKFMSTLAVQEPIQALYLAERLTNSREKMSDLLGPGVELLEPSLAQLAEMADNPRRIAAYDLVVIDDRPAETIPLPVQEAIVKAVKEDGVGLFYAGGKGVYGTGGYFDTPVASVLPVEMIQKEEKRDPSTTLVVIIDTSGSMTGERVQLAKECARLAIRRLLPHDKVGIVEFYGTKQWAAPIQSAANAIDIQRALNRLDAGGGTVILPAIEEAFYAMQNVQTRYKHVLVLTDGGVESGDFESLMRRMTAKGINVSTVLVGNDAHSEFLVNIANWGKGHFYCASSRFSIPEVLFKQPSTSKIPPYRPGLHLVSMEGSSGWWGDIPRPQEPKLSGYVETRLRPGAQVIVETETERHPILASWRYGLGRVSAFATEPVGYGTAPWRQWDGYGAWLLRVLSRTSREYPQPFAYTIERSRTHARIVAQRLIPQPYRPQAERLHGDGTAERLLFQQRSPDVFTAKLWEDSKNTLHLRAGAEGWPGSTTHLVSPAWHAVAPEHNVDPARAVDFSLLASATGGRNVSLENIAGLVPATGGMGTAKDLYRLWTWCLILGLLAYFSDLLFRRWPGSIAVGVKKLALLWLVIGFSFVSAANVSADLSTDLEVQLQDTLKEYPYRIDDGLLYHAALLENEALEPLLAHLNAIIKDDEKAFGAIWLTASLQWRYGNLDEALRLFEKAAEIKSEPLVLFRVAQLLDAQGKTAEAVEQYFKTLEAKPDDALAEMIQLRLAILKSTGTQVAKVEEDLATYAMGRDQAFQNRASVVLALTGKPKEAISLYKPAEDGNQRFKQMIRIAEWAMAANNMARAQESAWDALRAAQLKRDRRYALTVLAESYRRDKKLDQLIERFAATPGLSAEARMVWIDLLHEQGDADKALALFQETKAKAGGSDVFTAEMCRTLLEICREAGRDDLLIENFRKMIAKEPRRLEWRLGLCRFYLERGERDKGQAVWADYQQQTLRGDWLAAAGAIMELGLDGLAQSFAENMIRVSKGKEQVSALQFLFDLHKARGREDDMREVLERMDELVAPDASERARLAESWEQLGRQDKAAQVLEKLRVARGTKDVSSDLETRLAWLYSETGDEEKAYEAWKRAWLHIDSPGQRRYIEDRLMATASRLGKLADIAIELEEKLAEGTADKRDSALLVRLYTKVGDPVSASEIIHDFMKQSGGAEIQMLEEQALVYVMCNDYYHYEETLRKLMQLDPNGSPEYLAQLAMSALERGRNDEARAILTEMRGLEANPASAEFEAGVLKIAGMHEEAAGAYWRGIAQHPDRIDAYLLLGHSLQILGKGRQAVGLFQYLVENADEDDLFTIAVDGLLNMNNPQQGMAMPSETLLWAQRAILERIAGKDDKVYLFQLLRDVSEDLKNRDMMIRALAETLPIAGEQRTSQLRELMELARSRPRDQEGILRFGLRLVGIGEIIPPQVYLDLGSIFLESGDIRNAVKTFDKANSSLDQNGYQRKVAETFDQKRYIKSALRSYEQLLITAPDDPTVLVKVGELKELFGRDDEASIAYRRALDVLIGGQPLFSFKGDKSVASRSNIYYYSRNVDPFDRYYMRVLTGFLATADPGGKTVLELIDDSLEAIRTDLELVQKERATVENTELATIANVPRIARRSRLISRLALADGHLGKAATMEQLLLETFPEDKTLLPDICRAWDSWGYRRRARDLVSAVPANPGREQAWQVLGDGENSGARQVFRLILSGDRAGARARLLDLENVLGERGTTEEIDLLFNIARCLEDPAAAERLARFVINKAPGNQKLLQSIQMLTQAFPYLDESQRARLVDYVESVLKKQGETGAKGVSNYYYTRLKQFTGKDMKLPLTIVQPLVEKLLATASYDTNYIASMFCFLNEEDFRTLLRETYRKAPSSDRLAIIFSLIRQYPGKMDAATEELFIELASEAAGSAMGDPLSIYQANAQRSRYGNAGDDDNAGFEARLLEKFAEGESQDKLMGYLVEQVRAWHRGGETQRGMEAAGRLLSLAVPNDKAFNIALSLQRELPSSYLEAFLAAMDKIEQENGFGVDLEKKRLLLVRETRDSGRLLTALREAIRKFPKEPSFRQELRQELEKEERYYEAIEVLEALADLEPDNQKHRDDLRAAWTRLDHPFKARAAMNKDDVPNLNAGKQAAEPVSQSVASSTSNPLPSMPAQAVETTREETKERPMEPTSTQLIKKLYEAGEIDAARLRLRDLWRRFSALDQASQTPTYRSPDAAHTRYYEWPGQKSPPEQKTTAPTPPEAALGGLKAFLVMEPLEPPTSPYGQSANPTPPSVFSVIGSEEFAARELRTWLRTFDPQNYQAAIFGEVLREVVKYRISEQGLELFLNDAIARFTKDELSTLDQYALLVALGLHPETDGEAADLFLDTQIETLEPDNLWKMVHMARCFLKRDNEEAAISIYQWFGANFSHWSNSSYGSNSVNPAMLVEEIRENFGGASRVRALGAVLPLITPNNHGSSLQRWSPHFVLSTWAQEIAPHEVYQRCPDICREVVRADGAEWDRYPETLVFATLFLAAAGNTQEALNGLKLLLDPQTIQKTSFFRSQNPSREYILQQWLPENMTNWSNADRWLSGIVERIRQWETERKLLTADAVKIMSLVAVRQHQNNFKESAQTTLAQIGKLSLTNPNAAIWFSDAAEITGNQAMAMEVATTLLKQRRLPIVRVASLMEKVAEQQGVPAALQLAEETLDYTWERGFLQTMTKICKAAGDQERTRLWEDRYQQVTKPDDTSTTAAVDEKAEEDYQRLCEASKAEQHVKTLELGEAFLVEHPDHPKIATALHLAAKSGVEILNFKRAVSLFRRILEDHPDFDAIDEVRFKLAQCLSGMRALEECIKQCRENLEAAPESSGADYWRFLIPQSQFRLWRFKEAEEGLKDFLANYPRSDYADYAEQYLEKINPSWKVDDSGIGEYSGKYNEDYRFKAALAALPGYIEEGREKIRERLGVDIDFKGKVNFIFRDAGQDSQGGLMAKTFIICRDYKPVTVIQFYAEHVVIDPEGYRRTAIHEMKHAGFKTLMGKSYDDLPDWVAEGLAQWAAEELDRRIASKLNSETFAGKDPVSQMNGVANPIHDVGDYLEDVLAFEWLEKQKKGNVIAFGEGLVKGEAWQKLLTAASSLDADEAIRQMDIYCRDRVAAELGPAGRQALALRDTFYAKGSESADALNTWLREEGNRLFAEWVDEHPGHVLETVVRFYSGRGLILTGQFARGREWLRSIIDSKNGNSLCDDALFWEGYAFQQEKRMEDAAHSFGVLLRDYSWSNSAQKVRDNFKPAGPELAPSSHPRGTDP